MKKAFLISCVIILALVGLSRTPDTTLDISVTETDDGIVIENTSGVDCVVFVSSPEGEQRYLDYTDYQCRFE